MEAVNVAVYLGELLGRIIYLLKCALLTCGSYLVRMAIVAQND